MIVLILVTMITHAVCSDSSAVLLHTSLQKAQGNCSAIRIFNIRLSKYLGELEDLLRRENISSIDLWNGYSLQSDWLVNLGCFKEKESGSVLHSKCGSSSVTSCNMYCAKRPVNAVFFAISMSECICLDSKNWISHFFHKSPEHLCSDVCGNRTEERCGGQQRYYNIYKKDTNSAGSSKFCRYYDSSQTSSLVTSDCDISNNISKVVCNDYTSRTNQPTWTEANQFCSDQNTTLITSTSLGNVDLTHAFWLNERVYSESTSEKPNNLQECMMLRMTNGGVENESRIACNKHGLAFACSRAVRSDGVGECTTNNVTATQTKLAASSSTVVTSSSMVITRIRGSSTGSSTIEAETKRHSTVPYISNTNTLGARERYDSEHAGVGTGTVVGIIVPLLVTFSSFGLFIYFYRRKLRQTESENQYQDVNGMKSKTKKTEKAFSNRAYCSGATADSKQSSSNRNSQDAYMTIADQDLNKYIAVNSNDNETKSQFNERPCTDQTYFILEAGNKSCSNDSAPYELAQKITGYPTSPNSCGQTTYDLAKPVSNLATSNGAMSGMNEGDYSKSNLQDTDYDHLRQDVNRGNAKPGTNDHEDFYADDTNLYHGTSTNVKQEILNEDEYSRTHTDSPA